MSNGRSSPQPIEKSGEEKAASGDCSTAQASSRSFTIEAILSACPTNTRKRRKNSRGPRIPFTGLQVQRLEEKFRQSNYLSSDEVMRLAMLLNLSETRIKIWFQNRRARMKKASLRSSPQDSTIALQEKRWLCES